jgi:membrane associated rhomboid family serine protease
MKYLLRSSKKEPFFNRISVTMSFIILSVIISISVFILLAFNESLIDWFALRPLSIMQGKYLWTLLLHIFVHGNFGHLFINLFVLFSLGMLCERIIGRKRFLWFYLLSGMFAGILSVLASDFFGYGIGEKIVGSPEIYMVGASGAIFAIAGLIVVLLPKIRFMIIFLPFFSLPAYIMVPFILILTWLASIFGGFPIGNVAHFGGFLYGLVYGVYLRQKYKKKIALLQRYFR